MKLRHSKAKLSWGRVVKAKHRLATVRHREDIAKGFSAVRDAETTVLAHGLGRSYGDSNLNDSAALMDMQGLDQFIAFDKNTGILRAEAGVSLSEILKIVVPYGFFLHTTPGTRYVTLGGAVANDVHGKNHHSAGSFGENVLAIGLERSDRGHLTISRKVEPELFHATIGGLGMTGIITWVEMQLVGIPSALLNQSIIPFANVNEFFTLAKTDFQSFEHTVTWIDCTAKGANLGRGFFAGANWAPQGELKTHSDRGLTIPLDAPNFTLNPFTLKAFNTAYRWRQAIKPAHAPIHYSGCFYPLDAIGKWNRLYGSKGFYQYQSVVPMSTAPEATREMLEIISQSGEGSLLAVLKTFGEKPGQGLLSFPKPGVTLALDFRNQGQKTLELMGQLDAIVSAAGGRLYPAKDGRMPAAMFQKGYPAWTEVEAIRDPLISSTFWRRVTQK